MSSEIEKYRDKKAVDYKGDLKDEQCFSDGFDACMDLNLPVLFAQWIQHDDDIIIGASKFHYKGKAYIAKSLYNYWLNNIFKKDE